MLPVQEEHTHSARRFERTRFVQTGFVQSKEIDGRERRLGGKLLSNGTAGRKLARDDACKIPGPSPQGTATEERVAPSDGVEVWARYEVPMGTIPRESLQVWAGCHDSQLGKNR